MRNGSHLLILLILLSVAMVGVGCAMPVQAQVNEMTISVDDHFFEAPTEIEAGLVSITLENIGQEVHHMNIFQLKEGVTPEQVQAAFPSSHTEWTPEKMAGVMELLEAAPGGPGPVSPGGKQRVTLDLAPGYYMLLCVLTDAEGKLHLKSGMMAALTVTGERPANQVEPMADATVKLVDFSFALPLEVKAGEQTWQIVNEGHQLHEIYFLKLADGKTLADVVAYNQAPQGEPPFAMVGGFQSISPGQRGWLHITLEPGNYVVFCPIPDLATAKSHQELGMILPLTVQ